MAGRSSRFQCSTPPSVFSFTVPSFVVVVFTCPPIFFSSFLRSASVPGSGKSVAMSADRAAASGRRAGQMCSVEMCPWRTFFSCTESSEVCLSGKAASIRRRSGESVMQTGGRFECGR